LHAAGHHHAAAPDPGLDTLFPAHWDGEVALHGNEETRVLVASGDKHRPLSDDEVLTKATAFVGASEAAPELRGCSFCRSSLRLLRCASRRSSSSEGKERWGRTMRSGERTLALPSYRLDFLAFPD